MPSGSPKMTIRQGCEHVTVDSGSGTVSNVSCCQVPPPGGTNVPTSTTNTTTTASTSKIEGLQRRDSNSDLRNGNVKLRRSSSDLVRLPRSCRNVKMGRCDLRLGNCDVSLGTGDIILGTGEILKSNGEIYQLNGNVRTLSCNSVKSHSALRRTKSSCVKGTTGDHRNAKAHNTHNTNCPNSPLTSSKRSGGKGESVNKQTSNKHKNLRNRRHSLNTSSSKASTVNSEKVRGEPVNMEISDICLGSSSDVNIASSNEVLTNCNDCLPSTSSDITSCNAMTEKVAPALVDDHLDNVSELMDQLPSCASTSLSSTSSCTTNSHAPSSIDITNCCENTPSMPASPSLSDAKRQTSDGGASGVSQKSRPRIRRSQSDFLKSNRKLRRASVSIQEDGNVKVIMHGQATNTTSMLSLPTTSVTTSVPTTKTKTSRKGSLPDLETQQNSDVNDTKELCTRSANGVDQVSGGTETEVEPENGCTPTENDATPAKNGSTTPREIPKWKQRPHPLIPDPERHSRPWWEASADDETDTESLLEDVGFSRSSSLSSLASLLHPPPDYVATSEMSLLLQTLRHHYLFKVYMPMYRLLHLQSRRNDREEIRRKLAMGVEEEYYGGERMYKKPNLQTRLQSGMNLQICFMNEATSDVDSINGDDPAANPKSPSQRINSEVSLFFIF